MKILLLSFKANLHVVYMYPCIYVSIFHCLQDGKRIGSLHAGYSDGTCEVGTLHTRFAQIAFAVFVIVVKH